MEKAHIFFFIQPFFHAVAKYLLFIRIAKKNDNILPRRFIDLQKGNIRGKMPNGFAIAATKTEGQEEKEKYIYS